MTETDLQSLADKFLIRELIDEYSNVCTIRTWDRLGDLFVEDCAWRTQGTHPRDFRGREAVVAAITAAVENYPLIFQMPHAPRILLDGDRATATTLMHEIGKLKDGATGSMIAIYHDTFVRAAEGWKFEERVFQGLHYEAGPVPAAP